MNFVSGGLAALASGYIRHCFLKLSTAGFRVAVNE